MKKKIFIFALIIIMLISMICLSACSSRDLEYTKAELAGRRYRGGYIGDNEISEYTLRIDYDGTCCFTYQYYNAEAERLGTDYDSEIKLKYNGKFSLSGNVLSFGDYTGKVITEDNGDFCIIVNIGTQEEPIEIELRAGRSQINNV